MKRFTTVYERDGHVYGGYVDALDFEHAQMICDARGLGEAVNGLLYLVVKAGPNVNVTRVDEMISSFGVDDEPPDAEEFGFDLDEEGTPVWDETTTDEVFNVTEPIEE